MSAFEEGLRQARRRQVRFYLGGVIGLVVIGLVVIGVLASTSGTVMKIVSFPPKTGPLFLETEGGCDGSETLFG